MINNNTWIISDHYYEHTKRRSREAVFTLGNGYIGCRGFFEEDQKGIEALGGIYMAGVFGVASYKPWKGMGRELVNTPNFFYVSIKVDKEQLQVKEGNISQYLCSLDMENGILSRSFLWQGSRGQKVKVEFERFISLADVHLAGQRIKITPIESNATIEIECGINANIKNLNEVSCEPLPIQPGRIHTTVERQCENAIEVLVSEPELVRISEVQKVNLSYAKKSAKSTDINRTGIIGKYFRVEAEAGMEIELVKLIDITTSNKKSGMVIETQKERLEKKDYETEIRLHQESWAEKWQISDIQVKGNDEDQRALRYNIFQLIQACPRKESGLSIGARGLTGEMYEGCAFWDTEIFELPFFIYTQPESAKTLLQFRYNCLKEAKEHAENNWFRGAMYPWQSSENGIEQTPQGVGAFYSIHITADIAFAIKHYWDMSGDNEFITEYGAEVLIETARFWESRTYYNPVKGNYNILAVRGPNEYDVIVNNNVYTNMMAQQNLVYAIQAVRFMQELFPLKWKQLKKKLSFREEEMENWEKIIDGIVICYNSELDLYEEDDMYLNRVPLDLKRAKPAAKRIIDSTLPYEALSLYQVSKQADIICLMNLLPWKFTERQKCNAWEYYEPKTAHDTSLSYSSHAIMAARLGIMHKAYQYFKISAYLDIQDIQLNTISGLHFANFGGTWQAVVFGFAGVNIDCGIVKLLPNLPENWSEIQFKLLFRGNLLNVNIKGRKIRIILEKAKDIIKISIREETINLIKEGEHLERFY